MKSNMTKAAVVPFHITFSLMLSMYFLTLVSDIDVLDAPIG